MSRFGYTGRRPWPKSNLSRARSNTLFELRSPQGLPEKPRKLKPPREPRERKPRRLRVVEPLPQISYPLHNRPISGPCPLINEFFKAIVQKHPSLESYRERVEQSAKPEALAARAMRLSFHALYFFVGHKDEVRAAYIAAARADRSYSLYIRNPMESAKNNLYKYATETARYAALASTDTSLAPLQTVLEELLSITAPPGAAILPQDFEESVNA